MKTDLKRIGMLTGLLALGLAAGPFGCRSRSSEASEGGEAHLVRQGSEEYLVLGHTSIPNLNWLTIQAAPLSHKLQASGLVNYEPRRVVSIISRVQGRIEDTRVNLWDTVKKGDRILQLYSPDLMTAEAEYLQARAAADDISEALLKAARLKLALLGMSTEDINGLQAPQPTVWIRAPAGGMIVEDKVMRGSAVNPGDALLTVGTLEQVWITADLYEEDAARLEIGQKLEARVPASPGEVFKGKISNISPEMNPDTHTFQVRSTVANPDHKLKPRMLADVAIFAHPETALQLPQGALIFETDGYYAFVQTDKGILRRKVETASGDEKGFVRVLSGLTAGERVAVSETIQLNALWHRAEGEGA
jgi:Cu(I)/Ag(I) efflux system membrane fusion protein